MASGGGREGDLCVRSRAPIAPRWGARSVAEMVLASKRHRPGGLRAALGSARETYRHVSGADAAAEPEKPPEPEKPAAAEERQAPHGNGRLHGGRRLPALAARGREAAARRLREHRNGAGERAEKGSADAASGPAATSDASDASRAPDRSETRAPDAIEQPVHVAAPVQRPEPDVVVDIPHVHVDEIDLKLDELRARVALDARVMDLLQLKVGVDAELRGVGLTIKGVDAEAHLRVRLENLTVILDRVMNTVDANPQLLERLVEHLGATLEDVGSATDQAVGEIGLGAGSAVGDLGHGAGSAVGDIGHATGSAVGDIGESAGAAVQEVGGVAGRAPDGRREDVAPPAARDPVDGRHTYEGPSEDEPRDDEQVDEGPSA
jgi:hypothetical protein